MDKYASSGAVVQRVYPVFEQTAHRELVPEHFLNVLLADELIWHVRPAATRADGGQTFYPRLACSPGGLGLAQGWGLFDACSK